MAKDTQVLEIDDDLSDALAEKMAGKLKIDEKINEAVSKTAETILAKIDKPKKKHLGNGEDANKAKDIKQSDLPESLQEIAKMSKERRFFKAAQSLASGDLQTLRRFNEYSRWQLAEKAVKEGLIDLAQKAGYANDATGADGGVLVPDPEFNTTVYENLPKYGVAFADANVRPTDRTAVYALSLDSTLQFYQTAEAGVKQSAKLGFSRKLVSLLKYAVIVPATEELTEDSIVDYWNIVTNEISRAYAKQADQIVFTDSSMGILHTSGIITQPLIAGGAGTNISWDDLLSAEGKLEDGLDTSNFKFYMRKEVFFLLAKTKTSGSGQYLGNTMMAAFTPNPNNPTTPWGTPIKFTRVLPKSTEVSANGGFVVYGDLKNYNLYNKNGMEVKMLTEASITDANNQTFNLATQDGIAMRVVVRMLGVLPGGNASKMCVVGTGTVS